MPEKENSLQKENQHVTYVINEVNKKIENLEKNVGNLKESVISLRRDFWDDVTVNVDEPDDVIETFYSIKQQAELLGERERSHKQFHTELKILNQLKNSPYFGRIDFCENGESDSDKIYIGIASMMDEEKDHFLIYDWRAPICSIYYDFPPGPASYQTPEGTINGILELKRQFIIRDGKINSMFDTGVTIGDELLQQVLGNNADTQMKSIVATIQKEQNLIIRNEKSRYLVVQGVAGSGKTSAALQRVAYLLYRYRHQLKSENILLFSPNPLFNSYVATVLPELGEENMEQRTFQEFIETKLGDKFKVEDPFSQMECFYTEKKEEDYDIRLESIRFKASSTFKNLLDEYLLNLSNKGITFKDIIFRGEIVITSKAVEDYFYSLDKNKTIPTRLNMVSTWLLNQLKSLEKRELTKDWVIEERELLDKEEYLNIYNRLQKRQRFTEGTFDDFSREEQLLAKYIAKKKLKPLNNMINHLEFVDVKSMYMKLFQLNNFMTQHLPKNWDDICKFTFTNLEDNFLAYEDSPAYLYLQVQLKGDHINTSIRHLFIDEAQDYTPLQFALLKLLYPNSKMTILGDFNQAIYAHTLNGESLLTSNLYESDQIELIKLKRSYRSTKQIVEFTKHLLLDGNEIEAFNREGSLPSVTTVSSHKDHKIEILKCIETLKNQNYQTIAIICKTAKESNEAYNELKDSVDIKLMKKNTASFNKGILILPAYLAKGIEFDAVIIYNCSNQQYSDEIERKLFYTACTRAMHELHFFSIGQKSYLFDNIPNAKYLETN